MLGRTDEPDDHASFVALVRSRQAAWLRTAYLLTGDQQQAEDLLQGALAKLAQHWPRIRTGEPEGFVRTVLYRDAVSWWRRNRRERVGGVPERVTVDPSDRVDRRLVLEQALAALTPRQRAVLVLRFYEDLSTQETARALGVSAGTVKSQTSAALSRLRIALRAIDGLEIEQERT